MKPTFSLWLIVTAAAFAQSQPNGSASTTGKCSVANTGSKNTFTINCGIDKAELAQALLRHKSMSTTLNVYKKAITPEAFRSGMKALAAATNRTRET